MDSFEIQTLNVNQLIPAPYNPRKPLTRAARDKLRTSLVEFGLVEPLVWNEISGYVVGGHARLELLIELGFTDVPVSVVRLDPQRERALNVMLNNLEAQGRYDSARLRTVLLGLDDACHLSGFSDATIRTMQLEPQSMPCQPLDDDHVEIRLIIERDRWPEIQVRLDELIQSYDLESHVSSAGIIR